MKRLLKNVPIFLLFLLIMGGIYILDLSRHVCFPPRRSGEIALQQSLWTVRRAIDFYWQDKERPPQSLQELVNAGYLHEIPADPFTKSNRTWVIEQEKAPSVPGAALGVLDIHSGVSGADTNGKAYNQY